MIAASLISAAYVIIAAVLCASALLALVGIGHLALSGSDALERDGLARGRSAPVWTLPDTSGTQRKSPSDRPLQLIVFGDHSLKSFPSVVSGLRALRDNAGSTGHLASLRDPGEAAPGEHQGDLEIVILTRGPAESSQPLLRDIGLAGIPVVSGSPSAYGAYNVRVMPFAIFVGSDGLIRASSLVNHDWQLAKLLQVAAIPLDQTEMPAPARLGIARLHTRRLFRAAV